MARKKQEEHVNHERWLVSYADFITLLFAFFVVMFASAQADKGNAQKVSDSVKKALDSDRMTTVIAAVLGGTKDDQGQGNAQMHGPGGEKRLEPPPKKEDKLAELLPSLRVLSQELKTEIDAGKIQISMEPRGLVVSFKQAALFPSGEDGISPDALPSLDKIAAAIIKIPNPVRLEGHADSVRINTKRFHNNWELSTARATEVVTLLAERYGLDPQQISVAGYSQYRPVASNETEEGRKLNRRVDLVVVSKTEPASKDPLGQVGPQAKRGD